MNFNHLLAISILSVGFVAHGNESQETCAAPPADSIQNYSLIDSLVNARSRRFGSGFAIPGGPLKYSSQKPHKRLTEEEEALLVFSAVGINGYALGDLPYHVGTDGGGQMMVQFVGRTTPSGDAGEFASLLVVNDDGVYFVKRAQELTPQEIQQIAVLYKNHKWVDAYHKMRVKILDKRVDIPRDNGTMVTVNVWSANQPGSTYFIPVIDVSAMAIASAFYFLNPEPSLAWNMLDDKAGYKTAGVSLDTSWANKAGRVAYVSGSEALLGQLGTVEVGAMVQSLRLMSQALGLGGFPHSAGAPGAWLNAVGFSKEEIPMSRLFGLPFYQKFFLKVFGRDVLMASHVGLEFGGKTIMKTFTPYYYGSVENAVRAFVDHKFGPSGSFSQTSTNNALKHPDQILPHVPAYTEEHIQQVIQYLTYLTYKYGRYPVNLAPLITNVAYQAHVIDPEFYDNFYKSDSISGTQRCRSQIQ